MPLFSVIDASLCLLPPSCLLRLATTQFMVHKTGASSPSLVSSLPISTHTPLLHRQSQPPPSRPSRRSSISEPMSSPHSLSSSSEMSWSSMLSHLFAKNRCPHRVRTSSTRHTRTSSTCKSSHRPIPSDCQAARATERPLATITSPSSLSSRIHTTKPLTETLPPSTSLLALTKHRPQSSPLPSLAPSSSKTTRRDSALYLLLRLAILFLVPLVLLQGTDAFPLEGLRKPFGRRDVTLVSPPPFNSWTVQSNAVAMNLSKIVACNPDSMTGLNGRLPLVPTDGPIRLAGIIHGRSCILTF